MATPSHDVTLSFGSALASVGEPRRVADFTFDGVYRDHVDTVARWVVRLGGPRADREDLTQEVFVVVDRKLAGFRGECQISSWLFRITANVVANDRRRRAVRPWWGRWLTSDERQLVSPEGSALDQMLSRERHLQFYQVLDSLRERYRTVLVLFEIEQMSTGDIAELLGERVGNVRLLLHRARVAFLKEMVRRDPALVQGGRDETLE